MGSGLSLFRECFDRLLSFPRKLKFQFLAALRCMEFEVQRAQLFMFVQLNAFNP